MNPVRFSLERVILSSSENAGPLGITSELKLVASYRTLSVTHGDWILFPIRSNIGLQSKFSVWWESQYRTMEDSGGRPQKYRYDRIKGKKAIQSKFHDQNQNVPSVSSKRSRNRLSSISPRFRMVPGYQDSMRRTPSSRHLEATRNKGPPSRPTSCVEDQESIKLIGQGPRRCGWTRRELANVRRHRISATVKHEPSRWLTPKPLNFGN